MDLGGIAGQVTLAGAAVTAAAGLLAAAGKLARWLWRRGRQLGHLLDDVLGEPAHADHPARPSLMARVGAIEVGVARVEQRLDEHLVEHRAAPARR